MFKVASYLNFKIPDVWEVLVATFLDSKVKIKEKEKISCTINILEKNSCYNAAFFNITSIQDLAFDKMGSNIVDKHALNKESAFFRSISSVSLLLS